MTEPLNIAKVFGERLRELRLNRKLTRTEVRVFTHKIVCTFRVGRNSQVSVCSRNSIGVIESSTLVDRILSKYL